MASGALLRRPAVLLALALCSVGGVVTILGRLASGPRAEQKRVSLSKEAGTKAYPAFSPDGQRIAYSARDGAKVEPFHIYIRTVATDTPRQLTSGTGSDVAPVWSPDGTKVAFQRLEEGRTSYIVTGVDGGSEQQVAAFDVAVGEAQPLPAVAWTADGGSLIVMALSEEQPAYLALVPAGGGEPKRITNPPPGSLGDSTPAVAPDGSALAFVRSSSAEGADIFLCNMTGGGVRRLTFDDKGIRGVAWTRDSRDLVYSANRFGGDWRLWRVPGYGGAPREIPMAGRHAEQPAVAAAGNRLAYTESSSVSAIWRARLTDSAGTPEARALIRSSGGETAPSFSPDGQKIADISDQTGTDEVWVSDAEGKNRIQVTHFGGPQVRRPRWSADGKTILFDASSDQGSDLYAIAATAGATPKRLVTGASAGVFAPDGKHIYYQSHGRIWKAVADGGSPEALSDEFGTGAPAVSLDGKTVYFRLRRAIWRVPAAGGRSEEAFVPDHDLLWSALQPAKGGIYYLEFERSSRGMAVSSYDFSTRKEAVVFRLRGSGGFSVSPDGKYILYPKVDQSETNLMVVENFR